MGADAHGGLVAEARAAAARGDWPKAHALFARADEEGLLSPVDLPVVADVAYAAGHLDVTIETWERAHGLLLEAGERTMAAGAAVRVAMHLLFDTALLAPVRGWLRRAESLLDEDGSSPAHAWHAVVRNYERLLAGDIESARRWAQRAITIGAACEPAAAAIGHVAEARALILDGETELGLQLLDEAGVAAVSGELDPLSTGVVYCEFVCALQGLAHYDRAEEWTEAMERWSRTNAIGSLHGRCRVHRAEILRLRGDCDQAEVEALAAYDELAPYLRRELGWPLTELGRIRLCKGDLDGAEEALLAAEVAGWDPQPHLALVWLAQGEITGAAHATRDALERPTQVPSKEFPPNTDLRRAPILAAEVEISLAAGDRARARAAAEELERVADRHRSKALTASAAHARAGVRLADGEPSEAVSAYEDALRLWTDLNAPYEIARTRLGLAAAHQAAGNDHRAAIETHTANQLMARLTGRTATTGPTDPSPEGRTPPSDAGDSFRCEGEYWTVVFDGHTTRLRDSKGVRHLTRLLAEPGREFHVLDLVAADTGGRDRTPALGDGDPALDERAKAAYRRRLQDIDDDIDEARANNDPDRAAQAEVERDLLLQELARAVGIGGRDRRTGSASERARAGVTRAIRQSITRLGQHNRALGEHLANTINTGTYCSYTPDPRATTPWSIQEQRAPSRS